MELTRAKRLRLSMTRGATTVALVVVFALLAYLSTRYHTRFDWSSGQRNTLSATSVKVLEAMPRPLRVTVYASKDDLAGRVVGALLARYQDRKENFDVSYVNPDLEPERTRALGVTRAGVLDIHYEGRTRRVERPSERAISNGLLQVARAGERWIAYLEGHGERDLRGKANHDLGNFGQHLTDKGFALQPLNISEAGSIPRNTKVLLIAGPRVTLAPDVLAHIQAYIDDGGNALWLVDPGNVHGLELVANALSLTLGEGTLIDPSTKSFAGFGLGNPTFVLVTRYGRHPTLDGFNFMTVFPGVRPLSVTPGGAWKAQVLLRTGDQVWEESGQIQGTVGFDADSDTAGPFDIAYSFTRDLPDAKGEQRIVVVADGDFLSNSALGNSGNLDLGLRFITWLSSDDGLLKIPARSDPDLTLSLTRTETGIIGIGWFIVAPLVLLSIGAVVWLRRRHR
ncbi:MAG: GldG family protein [Chromatiales bacterium]|jgi:ABC-type uncharacterized transport system involved in gliding motility auxiliary subunit|nr:GldG family protein [Chromatiales bacterium]